MLHHKVWVACHKPSYGRSLRHSFPSATTGMASPAPPHESGAILPRSHPDSCGGAGLAISPSGTACAPGRSLLLVHALDDLARLVVGVSALEVAGGQLLVVEAERDAEQ